jgi:hypothetical protein
MHLRWNPWEKTSLRLSGGRGYRTANPIAENIAALASVRRVTADIRSQQEQAWTIGAGIVQQFKLGDREGSLVVDAYRTQFVQRLITDLEQFDAIRFYTIQGGSFSNVLQLELNAEVLPRLDFRLAWRIQEVKATYGGELLWMPLTPNQQGLVNFAWKNSSEKWLTDLTVGLTGRQRLPNLTDNHAAHDLAEYSPAFFRINAQVTRVLKPGMELYLGGENLGNYTQHMPVIGASDPFGPYFDASVAWGPLMGAMGYVGLRWDLFSTDKK